MINESVEEGKAFKQMANLNFSIYFEEIWDFHLTLMDWKTTTLEKEKEKGTQLSPSVEIRLLTPQAIANVTHSNTLKNTKMPHWSIFENGLKYRGTYNELRSEKLQIILWNHQMLGKTLIGSKTVTLKNFLDMNFIKTEMVIHKIKKLTQENIR